MMHMTCSLHQVQHPHLWLANHATQVTTASATDRQAQELTVLLASTVLVESQTSMPIHAQLVTSVLLATMSQNHVTRATSKVTQPCPLVMTVQLDGTVLTQACFSLCSAHLVPIVCRTVSILSHVLLVLSLTLRVLRLRVSAKLELWVNTTMVQAIPHQTPVQTVMLDASATQM